MFRKLKEFHWKTMEEYEKGLREDMEPWKQKIMDIHEKAPLLFYIDELSFESERGVCLVRGERIRGSLAEGSHILLLNGEGEVKAEACLLNEPEEKEVRINAFHKKIIQEFRIKLVFLDGEKVEEMEEESYDYNLWKYIRFLSLIINK